MCHVVCAVPAAVDAPVVLVANTPKARVRHAANVDGGWDLVQRPGTLPWDAASDGAAGS